MLSNHSSQENITLLIKPPLYVYFSVLQGQCGIMNMQFVTISVTQEKQQMYKDPKDSTKYTQLPF